MCIDFDGHHSGGSSFVYVNDFFFTVEIVHMNEKIGTSVSSEKEQLNESQYIVSRPELNSDPESGCDRLIRDN